MQYKRFVNKKNENKIEHINLNYLDKPSDTHRDP